MGYDYDPPVTILLLPLPPNLLERKHSGERTFPMHNNTSATLHKH